MAIRRPLYYEKNVIDSDGIITQINLKEMADSDITVMRDYCNWVYSRRPVVQPYATTDMDWFTLDGNGNKVKTTDTDPRHAALNRDQNNPDQRDMWADSFHTIQDTRYIPGTGTDHPHYFVTATDRMSLYTVSTRRLVTGWHKNPYLDEDSGWDRNSSSVMPLIYDPSDGGVSNRKDRDYPIYRDSDGSGNITLKSMSQQDMYDTFYANALDQQKDVLETPGTFRVKATMDPGSSVTGYGGSFPYLTPNVDSDGFNANPHGKVIINSSLGGNFPGGGGNQIGNVPSNLRIHDLDDSTYFGGANAGGEPVRIFKNTIHNIALSNAGIGGGLLSKYGSGIIEMEYWAFMYSKRPPFKQLVRFKDSDRSQGLQLYKMTHRQDNTEYVFGEEDRTCLASLVGRDMCAYITWKSPNKRLRYRWQDSTGGSGITRGDGLFDSRLNGGETFQRIQAGPDNYREQYYPSGTEVQVGDTWYLKSYFEDSSVPPAGGA